MLDVPAIHSGLLHGWPVSGEPTKRLGGWTGLPEFHGGCLTRTPGRIPLARGLRDGCAPPRGGGTRSRRRPVESLASRPPGARSIAQPRPCPWPSWQASLGGLRHVTVGLIATLTTVACVVGADTGAYFTGRAFGRTRLHSISPKKTVEGAAGGLVTSVAVALASWRFLGWPGGPGQASGLGALVFVSSVAGDLIESVIKRDAGLKDASNLIPGHGGLLDRLDSYLFTGACVYFLVTSVLPTFGV